MECKNLKQSIREGELLIGVSAPLNASMDQLEGTTTRISFRNYDHKLGDKYIDMGATILMESPKS